uniref:Nuclear protein MDM1 n=1 Tax=Pygocentrus nattereri TaxID=42514 RepID=A0AAR2LI04_PYGNA
MTVRFKGISEYQNKYRTRPRRVKSASPQRRMRLAGVRSDQLGISREPQFQSKRRVSSYPSQVPTSLQWGDSAVSQRQQDITRPGSPSAVVHVARTSSAEKVETPLAPRTSKPSRASKTIQQQEEVPSASAADQEKPERPSNGINHALKKKAGLRSERQRNGRQSSEYQRQFLWKTPVAESPLLAAQQMLYSSNGSIPPFMSNPVKMESEYKRNFKGSPPPRPPRLRRDMELNEVPQLQRENISPEKSKRKKRREQRLRRKSRPKEETHPEPQSLQQEVRATSEQKDVTPKVMRKMKTEYTSNFHSPLQYRYRDGAWVRPRALGEEVCELREKAEAYRRRAWGTHFSRQHLSQILSEQNCLWEASSASSSSTLTEQDRQSPNSPIIEALDLARVDSVRESSSPGASVSLSTSRRSSFEGVGLSNGPRLPVQRKLAWEEETHPCERGIAEIKQQREEVPEREPSSLSVASRCSIDEGRLPTPRLKTMLTAQRTHHDRTTPTAGNHKTLVILQAENGSLPRSSPTAGMGTLDLLPLREDTWAEDSPEPFSKPKTARTPQKRATSARLIADSSPHANRIQGTLRNPEFQHNGNLGLHRPDQFVFPSSDSGVSDDDDRLSQISSRSAASCSMASEVLDRAQRRKDDFWGKS